jgi:putative heme iron utilization protein
MGDGSSEVGAALSALLGSVRVGVLVTSTDAGPFGSHAPFLPGDDWRETFIHLSQLAQHTKNLMARPGAGFYLCEPDGPEKNPLSLQRVSFSGRAAPVPRGPRYDAIRDRYLARFPQSEMMFGLADFQLWGLALESALFVAGFGRAYRATREAPGEWLHQRT